MVFIGDYEEKIHGFCRKRKNFFMVFIGDYPPRSQKKSGFAPPKDQDRKI